MSNQPETVQERNILLAALDLPEEKREGYLLEACGGNVELKERLCKMLRAAQLEGNFMEKPAFEQPQTSAECEIDSTGKVIGPYKLLQIIGEGGMGTVYMAEQSKPVERRVALKIIKAGMDTKQVIGRFEAERQALAIMDHPNIAKVLDAGTTNSGHPYFVMELVKGVPITKYCDEKKLNLRQRLELMIPVCQAIQHAHQKGIIHRDIKPSNVLVAQYDGRPVPKVIDFGVAKATAQKLTEKTMFTEFGQVIGTLEYMSPEQAELNQLDIDTRSDVYSLGVLLYELLTGSTPLDGKKLRSAAFGEMLRMIREDEPQRPSNRLSTIDTLASVAANRQLEPGKLSGLMRGELDWIVMMALEKDRNRRYETANGMAMDIQRYLLDEPVLACPPRSGYRLRKFVRRNKVLLSTGAVVAATMCVGLVGTSWQTFRATRAENSAIVERDKKDTALRAALASAESESEQRRKAELAETEARQQEQTAKDQLAISNAVTDFLQKDLLGQAGSNAQAKSEFIPDPNITIRKALDRASAKVGDRFSDRPELEAKIRFTIGNSYKELGRYAEAIDQLKQSAAIKTAKLGGEHPDTMETLSDLASSYRRTGKISESIDLYSSIRDSRIKLLGPEDPLTLETLSGLAYAFQSALEATKAIELYEQVLASQVKILGTEHESTLKTMNNLAIAYGNVRETSKEIALLEQVIEANVRMHGSEHPNSLNSRHNLANAYLDAGKMTEAIAILEQVRDAKVKFLGAEHPDTLSTSVALADGYASVGKKSEAILMLEQARDAQIRILGPEHPMTLSTAYILAGLYRSIGKTREAIMLFEMLRDANVRVRGPEHRNTLHVMDGLALAYQDAHRTADAIAIQMQARDARVKILGPEHPDTLTTLNRIAVILRLEGKTEEAIELFEQVRNGRVKVLGPEHPDSLSTLNSLAVAYNKTGKSIEAIAAYKQVYDAQVKIFGPENPIPLLTFQNLACAYRDSGMVPEAIAIFEQVREGQIKVLGLAHRDTQLTFANLGMTYMKAGRTQDAITLLEEAYQASRKSQSVNSVSDQLLLAYEKAGKSDEIANLVPELLASARAVLPKDSPPLAGKLSSCGRGMLTLKNWSEAEPILRECLAIREKTQGDDWTTFNTSSMLGGSLLGQEKFVEAEPLLLAGYEGMKLREDKILLDSRIRITEAMERLIELYTAMQKPDQTEEWRKKREEWAALVESKSAGANVPPR